MFAMPVTLAYLADLWIEQGRAEEAAELVGLIRHQLTAISFAQVIAERVVTKLQDKLPPKVLTSALARGKTMRLDEAVANILRHTPASPK
jgi:hypothetical protein